MHASVDMHFCVRQSHTAVIYMFTASTRYVSSAGHYSAADIHSPSPTSCCRR